MKFRKVANMAKIGVAVGVMAAVVGMAGMQSAPPASASHSGADPDQVTVVKVEPVYAAGKSSSRMSDIRKAILNGDVNVAKKADNTTLRAWTVDMSKVAEVPNGTSYICESADGCTELNGLTLRNREPDERWSSTHILYEAAVRHAPELGARTWEFESRNVTYDMRVRHSASRWGSEVGNTYDVGADGIYIILQGYHTTEESIQTAIDAVPH